MTFAGTTRYGNPTFDCDGAHIRAHCRHLATVVVIHGAIEPVNVDRIGAYLRQCTRVKGSFVLDLSGVNSFAPVGLSLLNILDEACGAAGAQWTLVASPVVMAVLRDRHDEAAFPIASSVHEALRNLADAIVRRRQLLLPLIKKTA
ncbi:STAS domain-containing protein [Mycobacterium sp. SM1]|uniref:STAS domain-containing protein n=1 Tax=Mycobacterium sp. SM1 TaxID=2816243 RepID=UPI001BCD6FB4|nr:STAS domain-containing protein [Mycobacterium sp. SM1]MBS4729833.1 STAS domain-containing protein [Mycobacterium sp. SM1]